MWNNTSDKNRNDLLRDHSMCNVMTDVLVSCPYHWSTMQEKFNEGMFVTEPNKDGIYSKTLKTIIYEFSKVNWFHYENKNGTYDEGLSLIERENNLKLVEKVYNKLKEQKDDEKGHASRILKWCILNHRGVLTRLKSKRRINRTALKEKTTSELIENLKTKEKEVD